MSERKRELCPGDELSNYLGSGGSGDCLGVVAVAVTVGCHCDTPCCLLLEETARKAMYGKVFVL